MTTSVRVPEPYAFMFERAEAYVRDLFACLERRPEEGCLRIGGERYVMIRGESLMTAFSDQLRATLGESRAHEIVYGTARAIGAADARAFSSALGVENPVSLLSTGPVHLAYSGWAAVELLDDSNPRPDDFYLHYLHPNTFESEALRRRGGRSTQPGCFFSAGYSAGWCGLAFGIALESREIRCTARGDARCEFVTAPPDRLEAHVERLLGDAPADRPAG